MCKIISFLGTLSLAGLFVSGCAGPEQKLGRGISNTLEFARGGEFRRSVEQTAVFDSPDAAYTTGVIRGIDRSVVRTGVGLWEIVSFPFPNQDKSYDPIFTSYLAPNPVYPDSYKPELSEDSTFDTDAYLGFDGGDVLPIVPGSRFTVFGN
jgi:putative exosortase-associated protein (TIGR04073 family)